MNKRLEALNCLTKFSKPISILNNLITKFPWDPEPDFNPIVLSKSDLASIFNRFLNKELSSLELEDWADLIECREDIEYEKTENDLIKEIIIHLANPSLFGSINKEKIKDWLKVLFNE